MKKAMIVMVMLSLTGIASATITGIAVPATTANTVPASGTVVAYVSGGGDGTDNAWCTGFPWDNPDTQITSISAWGSETVPTLTTTVSGLNPAISYDVYVQFVVLKPTEGWGNVAAALAGNTLQTFTNSNSTDTGLCAFDPAVSTDFGVYEHSLGTVSGVSSFSVNAAQGGATHYGQNGNTFYVGVSYAAVPEPMTLGLLAMGAVSFLRRRV